jgi:glycosyltransferase
MQTISVITAVYNARETIGQALTSVISQTYPSVELIVIDGGSTDGTLDIVKCYSKYFGYFASEPDDGIYHALNKGILNSSGDIVGFLHSDDVFDNHDVLAKVAKAFEDPMVEAVYGDLIYVKYDDTSKVVRYWKSGHYDAASLSNGWMPPHPTFYVRRSVYDRLGGFDTRYRIAADYDTVLRFLAVGKISTVYIPEVFVRMRVGGISNRSWSTIIRKSFEDLDILKRNRVGGIVSLINKNVSKLSQFWLR